MKWARFKPDGTALMVLSRRCAGGVSVPDGSDVRDLYRDPQTGKVANREQVTLKSARTIFCCDGKDAAPLPEVPVGATVLANGQAITKPVTQTSPTTLMIEAGGRGRSDRAIVWYFKTREEIREEVRRERTARLTATDWITMPDVVMSTTLKLAYTAYRTALRNLPDDQPNATIETVIWPKEPK